MCIRDSAIDYVTKKEKTEEKLVSGLHCEPETVKEEMQATKELWGKTDGRTYKPVSYTHLDVYKRQPISIMYNPTMRTRK